MSSSSDVLSRMPHRGPMLFLDEVLEVSGSKARARTVLRDDFILAKDGKVSSLVSIELFAQAAAAYMASKTSPTERPTVQGALLGSRSLDTFVDAFDVGDELIAEVEQVFGAGALAQFKCALFRAGEKVAEGNINVVSGSDVVRG